MINAQSTTFKSFKYNPDNKKVEFHYLVDQYPVFHFLELNKISGIQYTKNIDSYLFLCGMAIYPFIFSKYNPKKILVSAGNLNNQQLNYWKTWYLKGLGENFYLNKLPHIINLEILPNSPLIKNNNLKLNNKILLLNGGGKDSCVSAEILNQSKLEFEWLTIGYSNSQKGVLEASTSKVKNIVVSYQRFMVPPDYKTYSGHKPFTLYTSSVAILVSALKRYKYIFMSNEKSANFGNLKVGNIEINHQWTKSLIFERMYTKYLINYVNPELSYCSILKPLYELQIAKIFSKYPKYHHVFISCNRTGTKSWCNKCSKCAFIFLALYPFISRENVNKIFNNDLLDNKDNKVLFQQLIGEKDSKPFECVGTIEENRIAMNLAIQKRESKPVLLNEFKNTFKIDKNNREIQNFLIQYDEQNNIPHELKYKLRYNTLKLLGIENKSDIIEGFNQVDLSDDTYKCLMILLLTILVLLFYLKKNKCI